MRTRLGDAATADGNAGAKNYSGRTCSDGALIMARAAAAGAADRPSSVTGPNSGSGSASDASAVLGSGKAKAGCVSVRTMVMRGAAANC